jgi:eukaryotic-like serine/threonine-protein kinase
MKCPTCQNDVETLEALCPVCFLAEASAEQRLGTAPAFCIPTVVLGEEIARGGTGIVFRGEQIKPSRPVAVKIIHPHWMANSAVHHRFRREAQAMAGLEHPAILPVYEVGESGGLSWFTMKLAPGGSLARRITDFRGKWREIAALCATLAEALDYAHRRGVLHRDVKPGNVLFDADERPYLGDFGAAKHATDGNLTLPSDVIGTPNYLAPEIASSGAQAATTSADIYGLGTVLYELLSGRPPHLGDSLPELLHQIAHTAPPSLADYTPAPPRDLIAICQKAMEKDPRHRYATIDAMGADLRNFIAGKPTVARSLGRIEAATRWCRAHPALASLVSLVVLLLAAVAVISIAAAWRVDRARENAELHLQDSLLAQAASVRLARPPGFRQLALELAERRVSHDYAKSFQTRRRSEIISALAFPTVEVVPMPEPPATGLEFVTASVGWKFVAWNAAAGAPLANGGSTAAPKLFQNSSLASHWQVTDSQGRTIAQGHDKIRPDYLSADGQWIAAQRHDREWQLLHEGSVVFQSPGTVQDLSADGRLVAWHQSSDRGRLACIRDNATSKLLMRLDCPKVALGIKLSPDQQYCAVAPSFYSSDPNTAYTVRIYRCQDGALVRELTSGLGNCIWCLAWSNDGRSLLAAERNGPVYIWDTVSGNMRHILRGPGTQVWRAAFSPDNQMLALLAQDRLFSVIDMATGRPLVQGDGWITNSTSFHWQSPVSFGPVVIDGQSKLLQLSPGAFSSYQSPDVRSGILGIASSPDARWIVLGDARNAWLWDSQRRQAHPHFDRGLWNTFCFSPDGHWLYGAGEKGVKRWKFDAGGLSDPVALSPNGFHNTIALDRTGHAFVFDRAQDRHTTILQNPTADQPGRKTFTPGDCNWLDLSADGKLLVGASREAVRVWSVADGRLLHTDKRVAKCVRFSPDGQWLYVAAEGYEIWSTRTWQRIITLDAPDFSNLTAQGAFHPTRPLFAAGCGLGRIALWSTKDWSLLALIENPSQMPVDRLGFDAGGRRLHFGSQAGIFATWDFDRLERELNARGLGW